MSFDEATYELLREGCRRSAAAVVPIVYELLTPRSVIDVGGGEGWWARAFIDAGTSQALVLDESLGEVDTEEAIGNGVLSRRHFDLEGDESLAAVRTYDLAVCLEVAEHLAETHAPRVIAGLCMLAPVVLFSAVVPGQGGHGHVNEQWPSYWESKFRDCGYAVSDALRWVIWNDERIEPWYRQNLLLCASSTCLAEIVRGITPDAMPRAVVHPEIFSWRIQERDDLLRSNEMSDGERGRHDA